MSLISDLEVLVLDRLEESRTSPKFWDVQREIRVFLVEAINEATLITGEPEMKFTNGVDALAAQLLLPPNQTFIDLTGNIPLFGMMRLESNGQVKGTTIWDMDRMLPGWENDIGDTPDFWFPVGLLRFGIHPKLNAAVRVVVSGVAQTIQTPRPYTGAENVDYQEEYRDAIVDYAAHLAGLKEGTKEFMDSVRVYDRFVAKMQELSKFATRKGLLRFSRSMGFPANVTPVEAK